MLTTRKYGPRAAPRECILRLQHSIIGIRTNHETNRRLVGQVSLLKRLADMEHEVHELSEWFLHYQGSADAWPEYSGPVSQRFATGGHESSFPQLNEYIALQALWRIKAMVNDLRLLRPSTSAQILREASVVVERLSSGMSDSNHDELLQVRRVMEALHYQFARLHRHGITPRPGSILGVLFANLTLSGDPNDRHENIRETYWARQLGKCIRTRISWLRRNCGAYAALVLRFKLQKCKMNLVRLNYGNDQGVLTDSDEEAYAQYAREETDGPRNGYLEPLRPLLGLPYLTPVRPAAHWTERCSFTTSDTPLKRYLEFHRLAAQNARRGSEVADDLFDLWVMIEGDQMALKHTRT